MKSAADDLERCRPVWKALTEFFLDTELGVDDYERIAGVLLESHYSIAELEHILWRELSPIIGHNLGSMAGEWSGIDQGWLERKILAGPPGFFKRWESYLVGGRLARFPWEKVKAILIARRSG